MITTAHAPKRTKKSGINKRRASPIPRDKRLCTQQLTSTHPFLLTDRDRRTSNLEFELHSRGSIVGAASGQNLSTLSWMALKKEEEIIKPPSGAPQNSGLAPKFGACPRISLATCPAYSPLYIALGSSLLLCVHSWLPPIPHPLSSRPAGTHTPSTPLVHGGLGCCL